MILLLPLWESLADFNLVSSAMQFTYGHPKLWWAMQSYEKLANLVIAIVHPKHLQAGIQVHLPRSTGLLIVPNPMPDMFTMCLEGKTLLDSDEELLIADPLVAFNPFQMKQAIYSFRASTSNHGLITDSCTSWWKEAQLFLHPEQQRMTLALSVPLRNFEENLPGQGQWVSQGEWR